MILVIRIAGQAKNKVKEVETLKRLRLNRKFTATLIDPKDNIRIGMIKSAWDMLSYGKVSKEFVEKLNKKRKAKDGIYFLHPPRGGFKKSSKVSAPEGILGAQEDITKLAERML